jgi:hypothetical protein
MLTDLELAKKRMEDEALTLCIARGGKVLFEGASRGISGFLDAVESLGDRLEGASVADRVVGKAVALLCVDSRVRAVYASTLSRDAKQLFDGCSVRVEWGELVESILDAGRRETCPFERLAAGIADPKDAYGRLRALQSSLRRGQGKRFGR